ncbi:MAG: chemotaxis response regulator protein-glutamate methylesterase [Methylococcaceae bacterium]|nr:MAG: chemotaxis response regulator protein-glutamate methylesterase [Methylococcaceae bacterium]
MNDIVNGRIKVLVVDDSAVVRQVATSLIATDPALELIGAASDPLFAMEKMKKVWPDVIVLDIEMPRMDGLTFLKKIMAEHPTPVVICSSLTETGADVTMQAMASGAVDIITKPKIGVKGFLQESAAEYLGAIRAAGKANPRNLARTAAAVSAKASAPVVSPKLNADVILSASTGNQPYQTTERLVAIGTSTGGTQALEQVLTALPRTAPGLVIVQHMPEKFTKAFADRLDTLCEMHVKEAENNDRVIPGLALIAPGGYHMLLKRSGAYYHVEIVSGPQVSRHRPSVDVLFRSVAKFAGRNAMGVIMTGMGDDGVKGMLEMHQAGSPTVAQDEASCVVYGMPKEAVKAGAVDQVMPLSSIPLAIMGFHAGKKTA